MLLGLSALSLIVLPLSVGPASAQAKYPSKSVHWLVGYVPGGTTDILARLMGQYLSEKTGQQFIVENKAGAGGNIAADAVAKAEPDGYTFIVGTPGTHAINQFVFKAMTYDQVKDIAPVIIIARVANLCSVTNSLPVKSVAELIAYAKSKPGELFYGTPGLGSTAHLSTELFKSMTGVDMTPEMLAKSRATATLLGLHNVEFRDGFAEALPVDDESADVDRRSERTIFSRALDRFVAGDSVRKGGLKELPQVRAKVREGLEMPDLRKMKCVRHGEAMYTTPAQALPFPRNGPERLGTRPAQHADDPFFDRPVQPS